MLIGKTDKKIEMHVSDGPRVGGRIRKAKVVFDPSAEQTITKRRLTIAAPNGIANEDTATTSTSASPTTTTTTTTTTVTTKPKKDLSAILKRRATEILSSNRDRIMNGSLGAENGCIVCTRTDVKKGRFVNCKDCGARGHFTCLRNSKMICTSEEELHWQCPTCQTCAICYESAIVERLYKCYICTDSYHGKCLQRTRSSALSRRNFKCDNCNDRVLATKKAGNSGFAGFSNADAKDQKGDEVTVPYTGCNGNGNGKDATECDPNAMDDAIAHIKTPPDSPESAHGHHNTDTESLDSDIIKRFKFRIDAHDGKQSDMLDTTVAVPNVREWDCDEIFTYFLGKTTAEYAELLKERDIDGDALMLMSREDVLSKFNLKLGKALRLYGHILTLQMQNNNPILAWDED